MLSVSVNAGLSQPRARLPGHFAITSSVPAMIGRSTSSGMPVKSIELFGAVRHPLPAQPVAGFDDLRIMLADFELSAAVAGKPWRSKISITRQMPTRTP